MADMKSTKIDAKIQRRLDDLLETYPRLTDIVRAIHEAGGRALLVGGAVRDLLLGISTKDVDIEIHGIMPDVLERVLAQFGHVDTVGKSFGVLRIAGLDVDWSIPRADSAGRKPTVEIDPHMPLEKAFARRDVTMNAMGIDLHTHELIDPFNGQQDLRNKLLRAPDITLFAEDPLRLFRVMQFIGRFDMTPNEALNKACARMHISAVSAERIAAEFEKMLLKSQRPSRAIRWLDAIGRLEEILPELAATRGVPQNPDWHPEGDVFEHTMQALDAAAALRTGNDDTDLILMLAILCHDLGKVSTTKKIDGRWRSFGHEVAGIKPTKSLLKRITQKKDLIADIGTLVRYHMLPGQFVQNNAGSSAYKRLARKLGDRLSLQQLAMLAYADKRGRNGQGDEPLTDALPDVETFLQHAQEARVRYQPEAPVLLGRDLLDVVKPGPELGKLVDRAYEIQIEEGITDKETLKKRVLDS